MAVIRVAVSLRHTQLMSMKQEPGQSIREFYANAKVQASTCEYSLKFGQTCCVEKPVIVTLRVWSRISLYAGSLTLKFVVISWSQRTLIEGKETARKAWVAGMADVSAASSYKRTHKENQIQAKLSLKTKCSVCDVKISQYVRNRFGRMNKVPFTKCIKCHKDSQPKQINSDLQSQASKSEHSAIQGFLTAIETKESSADDIAVVYTYPSGWNQEQKQHPFDKCLHILAGEAGVSVKLDHHIFLY